MKPSDANLTKAARRAERGEEAYKNQVLDSLRRIARARNERGFSIQVRFYPESQLGPISPVFRLMFIDASLCLVSYNVFGTTSSGRQPGSELPQLHLVSSGADETASKSFYHAMELFYQSLWDQAEQWDFAEFLSG